MSGNHINNKYLIEQLKWRYAVKKFDATKKVSHEDLKTLEEALVLSPSSYGLQPWKFLVITDQKIREELRPHAWGQPQITDCSHLFVLASKTHVSEADIDEYVKRIMEVRQTDFNSDLQTLDGMMKGFRNRAETEGWMQQWTHKQTYIALGFLMASSAFLGIDSCPMEGFVPAEFDRILGLDKEGYSTAVLCPVGYRSEEDWLGKLAKVRYSADTIVKHI